MIRTYSIDAGRCVVTEPSAEEEPFPTGAAWIDLLNPSDEEEQRVEALLAIDVPTRDEIAEIETSSRLYQDGDAVFMTATVVTNAEAEQPESATVTFVLTPGTLVTVRYSEPRAFRTFAAQARRTGEVCAGPEAAFTGLLEAIIDRIADVLEGVGADLDSLSRETFTTRGKDREFIQQLRRLGRSGDVISKVRESVVTIARLLAFARRLEQIRSHPDLVQKLKTAQQDVASLSEHTSFLASKTTFLLDATLGMINIEQNAIIKIFSVVAVMFLPPTLIASIYGMNFEHMPELDWVVGYPLALVAMVASMILPYLYFKRRGWL